MSGIFWNWELLGPRYKGMLVTSGTGIFRHLVLEGIGSKLWNVYKCKETVIYLDWDL